MNRNEAFNHLFEKGFDYQFYQTRSDRHQERMNQSYEATTKYLETLDQETIDLANGSLRVLCIAENWCGDCGNGVPVIAKIAEIMTKWNFTIAARDDFEELIEQYYTTAGRKKIPLVIFADEDGDEITRWVERPAKSYQKLAELQAKRLPKEEYIEEYRSNSVFLPPKVSENCTDEILVSATKAATMTRILPQKKRN